MDLTGLPNRWCASTAVHHVPSYIHVERKRRRKVANSFSFSSAGYVTSCGCMFNLFDGSRRREEYWSPCLPPRIPRLRRSPTQANVNYRRLWIILRRFQTAPGLLLFESACDTPFPPTPSPPLSPPSSTSPFSFVHVGSCPRSIVLSRPRLAFARLRKGNRMLPEKRLP